MPQVPQPLKSAEPWKAGTLAGAWGFLFGMNNRFKYVITIIFITIFGHPSDAQTGEMECYKQVHHVVDLFFIDYLGEDEYVNKRDDIKMWIELKLDSLGGVHLCKIRKRMNIDDATENQLCRFLCSNKFPCLILLYVNKPHSINDVKINFPFNPKQYPLFK